MAEWSPAPAPGAASEEAVAQASALAEVAGVLLLGETHGVVENAGVLEWFARRFGPAQVGLEWRPSAATALWEYATGLDVDVSRLRPSPDGRITAEHFYAARRLVKDDLLTSVAAFAPDERFEFAGDDRSQNAWESALAELLLASRDDRTPMIVMTGSVHALVDPQPIRGTDATSIGRRFAADPAFAHHDVFYPMRWHVAQAVATVAVRLRYRAGSYSNFGVKRFAEDLAVTDGGLRGIGGMLTFDLAHAKAAAVPDDAGFSLA